MSNDLDGVPDDGREPVDAAATGEAAGSSPAADASTGQQSAADGHDKPRTAPPGSVGSGDDAVSATDGVADGGEAVGSDVVAAPAGGTRRSGGVAAGSARAAARRSAAQAAGVNMPGGTAGTTDRRKSDGKGFCTERHLQVDAPDIRCEFFDFDDVTELYADDHEGGEGEDDE